MSERRDEPDPTRVVADPAVLAADLLVGGEAREALDHVRRHSWLELVASDELLAETERLVASLADPELAAAHRERLEADRVAVDQPEDDHPALASAYQGRAAHLLSYDDRLNSARAGLSLQSRVSVSVRPPDAFARLFDPESFYEATVGGEYPGPDADPRA
jgi:predicted nucleic acid-binding protein